MKNSATEYMHRLLAESLYRGFTGAKPSPEEATVLAIHSVRWFHELLLRLSLQSCIDEVDPIVDFFERNSELNSERNSEQNSDRNDALLANRDPVEALHPGDEALWEALCEGRLVLRIEGSRVNASVDPKPPTELFH